MSVSIKSVLKSFIQKHGLERALHKSRMPDYWVAVVGARVAKVSTVKTFENGTLVVNVSEPTWRSELILRRAQIITQLNTHIGDDVVKELIIR